MTIKHGSERFILFPYAELGTLYEFLHCGRDIENDKKYNYNFNERFNRIRDNDLAAHMLRQCEAVAGALKWLHSGITPEAFTEEKIFCAHLDLKPDNILIRDDTEKRCMVGKWVISDFNISVVERRGPHQDGVVIETIRDYYRQATMDMRPRRRKGTYQAPEVEQAEKQPTLRIGRRSDVWSFGCIFSEVLAFAFNRDKEVKRFNDNFRKRARGNNYFYDPKQLDTGYQVRTGVIEWLDDIAKNSKTAQSWGKCWVATIKDILVVELDEKVKPHRPDSGKLEELVKHVRLHEYHSGEGKEIHCPYLQPEGVPVAKAPIERSEPRSSAAGTSATKHPRESSKSRSRLPPQSEYDRLAIAKPPSLKTPAPPPRVAPPTGGHEQASPVPDTPAIIRSDTYGVTPISLFEKDVGRGPYSQDDGDGNEGANVNARIERLTLDARLSNFPTPSIYSDRKSSEVGKPGENSQQPDPIHRESNVSIRAPPNAEGIFIGHRLQCGRTADASKVHVTKNIGAFAVALSASENCIRAAFLKSNGVQVVNVDLVQQQAPVYRDYPLLQPKPFDQKSSSGIAFAGPYLAVWGYSGTKVVSAS